MDTVDAVVASGGETRCQLTPSVELSSVTGYLALAAQVQLNSIMPSATAAASAGAAGAGGVNGICEGPHRSEGAPSVVRLTIQTRTGPSADSGWTRMRPPAVSCSMVASSTTVGVRRVPSD